MLHSLHPGWYLSKLHLSHSSQQWVNNTLWLLNIATVDQPIGSSLTYFVLIHSSYALFLSIAKMIDKGHIYTGITLFTSHSSISIGELGRFFPISPHFTIRTTAEAANSRVRQVRRERSAQPHWEVWTWPQDSCVTFPEPIRNGNVEYKGWKR